MRVSLGCSCGDNAAGTQRDAGLGKRGGWMRLLLAGGQLLPELLSYLAATSGPFKKGNTFAGTETAPGFCSASLRANPLSASPEPGYHVAEHCGLPCFALLCFALLWCLRLERWPSSGMACVQSSFFAPGAAVSSAGVAGFLSPVRSLSMNISANEFAGRDNCMDSSFEVSAC